MFLFKDGFLTTVKLSPLIIIVLGKLLKSLDKIFCLPVLLIITEI